MAKFALIARYPPTKATEVNEVVTRQRKYVNPNPIIKRIINPVVWMDENGWNSFEVYEAANDKIFEGMSQLMWYMQEFANIEGYRYKLQMVATAEDLPEFQQIWATMDKKIKK